MRLENYSRFTPRSTEGNVINLARKIPIFIVARCYVMVLTHLFAPRSCAVKKLYGASLKQNGFSIKVNIYNRIRQHLSNYAKAQAY